MLLLPDVCDMKSVVANYVDTFFPQYRGSEIRELIIKNSLTAFEQLLFIVRDASATGDAEEAVLVAFMRDLVRMSSSSNTGNDELVDSCTPLVLH